MTKSLLLWAAVALVLLIVVTSWGYLRDMNRAYDRIRGRSEIVPSRFGAIEYSEGGAGPDVLVIHGGGGGYDQGEILAEAVLGEVFHWIAPSRFGYLGSGRPEGATWDDQADAYAFLLDHLRIDTVAVVALSQGGPSALLFAVRHPDRVSSLTCISCGVAPSTAEEQAEANKKGNMLRAVFTYDFPCWTVTRLFKKQFMGLMGANASVIAGLTPEQRELLDHLIDYMNPAAPRSAGAAFDNEAALPGERIAAVSTPALIVHAEDDLLQLFRNAEFAAATIPEARLLRFDHGGHLVLAVERDTIRAAVREHILGHLK